MAAWLWKLAMWVLLSFASAAVASWAGREGFAGGWLNILLLYVFALAGLVAWLALWVHVTEGRGTPLAVSPRDSEPAVRLWRRCRVIVVLVFFLCSCAATLLLASMPSQGWVSFAALFNLVMMSLYAIAIYLDYFLGAAPVDRRAQ